MFVFILGARGLKGSGGTLLPGFHLFQIRLVAACLASERRDDFDNLRPHDQRLPSRAVNHNVAPFVTVPITNRDRALTVTDESGFRDSSRSSSFSLRSRRAAVHRIRAIQRDAGGRPDLTDGPPAASQVPSISRKNNAIR
jgi:hypothetical protein